MKDLKRISCFGLLFLGQALAQAQFTLTTNYNGTLNLSRYTGTDAVVTIPSSSNGLAVTSIGSGGFNNSTVVTSVTIPDSVLTIHPIAFSGCLNLTNVTIGINVVSIEDYAFQSCVRLSSITLPESLSNLGVYVFDNCWALTNVTLPNHLTTLPDNTFSYCSKLATITIPSCVASMGNNVFSWCSQLAAVHFQGNAPTVGSHLFNHSHLVTAYCLPGTTGWDAFASATGLKPVLWQPQPQVQLSTTSAQSGRFTFSINGSSNLRIVVEASTNLAKPVWSAVETNNLMSGSSYFSDPDWKKYPIRFYRARTQ